MGPNNFIPKSYFIWFKKPHQKSSLEGDFGIIRQG